MARVQSRRGSGIPEHVGVVDQDNELYRCLREVRSRSVTFHQRPHQPPRSRGEAGVDRSTQARGGLIELGSRPQASLARQPSTTLLADASAPPVRPERYHHPWLLCTSSFLHDVSFLMD